MGELFEFKKPGEEINIYFQLHENNINTGYFRADSQSKLNYSVKISFANSSEKHGVIHQLDNMKPGMKSHFSFSNTERDEIVVSILANGEENTSLGREIVEMYFESKLDTFNKEISKVNLIEPAIYTLEQLLTAIKKVSVSTKGLSIGISKLGNESRNLIAVVFFFSFILLILHIGMSFFQVVLVRQYLREKKYL